MHYQRLSEALERLEAAMRAANMWRQPEPSAAALASQEPFGVDTLSMPQWLRFVLIARLDHLIATRAPLPTNAHITPAAEQYLQPFSRGARVPVIGVLREIDALLSAQ